MPNVLFAEYLGEHDNTSISLSQSSKVDGSSIKWLEPSATLHGQPAKKKWRFEKMASVVNSQCNQEDLGSWTSINFSNASVLPTCSGSAGFITVNTSFISLKCMHSFIIALPIN